MVNYPKDLYVDNRIEEKDSTVMVYQKKTLDSLQVRKDQGMYLRLFDGKRWYTNASSELNNCIEKLTDLSNLATPNPLILQHPLVKNISVFDESILMYQDKNIAKISTEEKKEVLQQFNSILENEPLLTDYTLIYSDFYLKKHFQSSLGSNILYDKQMVGIAIVLQMTKNGRFFQEFFQKSGLFLTDLSNLKQEFQELLEKAKQCLIDGKHVEAGSHTVILSPFAAGVFAHESFGHKSEADFMTMSSGSEMLAEWPLNKKVGSEQLSIVDDGSKLGGGYVPFDDEGTKAGPTYLIKNGILSGRLHSNETAVLMGEKPTGNARAINYEFDPIVRMTSTFIEPGNLSKEMLFESVDHGYLIDTIKHGSGMSRFTIAPSISYEIQSGKIIRPVEIAVLSGNVMETLHKISGLSDHMEMFSFAVGGCGKFEQTGLPVGLGGPYVRIDSMEIQ
jgi:TldD protein